jgi:hypothetical protein
MTIISRLLGPECRDILPHLPHHLRHGLEHGCRQLTADIELRSLNAVDHETWRQLLQHAC